MRIVDMARSLIRLSGLVPDKDVEIRFMILRRENEALADLDKHVLDLEIALRAIDSSAANPSSAA